MRGNYEHHIFFSYFLHCRFWYEKTVQNAQNGQTEVFVSSRNLFFELYCYYLRRSVAFCDSIARYVSPLRGYIRAQCSACWTSTMIISGKTFPTIRTGTRTFCTHLNTNYNWEYLKSFIFIVSWKCSDARCGSSRLSRWRWYAKQNICAQTPLRFI